MSGLLTGHNVGPGESTFYHSRSQKWFRIQILSLGTGFAMVGTDTTELRRASVNLQVLKYLPRYDSIEELRGKSVEELAEILYSGGEDMIKAYRDVSRTGEPVILEDFIELPHKSLWIKCRLFKAGGRGRLHH